MISNKIKNSIIKYLSNQASFSELEELELWIKDASNQKEFSEYVKINYLIDYDMKKFDVINSQKQLLKFINKEKKFYKVKRYVRFAAVVILFLSAGFFYQHNFFSSPLSAIVSAESITLKSQSGNTKILKDDGAIEVVDDDGNIIGIQKGNELIYNTNSKVSKLVYNTLSVPYGKRFALKLSDGTKINLNAGTVLRYPVKFIKGNNRQVFLDGEAYFDVAKDKSHPFIVNAKGINVRVLGTKFNMSSYLEDPNINTVLIEGLVGIYPAGTNYDSKKATLLESGYKATWHRSKNTVTIEKADVGMYTAWISGKIIFKHMQFSTIVKKLERHYNVEIINNNKNLNDEFITASFDLETIDQVFKAINEIHFINYSIDKNKIIIN